MSISKETAKRNTVRESARQESKHRDRLIAARRAANLPRREFAEKIGAKYLTLKAWELGRFALRIPQEQRTVVVDVALEVREALGFIVAMVATPAAAAFAAHYDLAISTAATYNVNFSNGVFSPKGGHAVLNENDLIDALTSGAVEVTTGNGYGGRNPGDLFVEAGLTLSGTNALTFDAFHSVVVDQPLVNSGTGALTITDNDKGGGGYFTIGSSGSITISSLSNVLVIDGMQYTLVADIKTLASDIHSNANGSYALASSYDASGDGTYHNAPIDGPFGGFLEGLGNTISNLSVSSKSDAGLSAEIGVPQYSTVLDLGLINVDVSSGKNGASAGALAGTAVAIIRNCYSTGIVEAKGPGASAGGLVGRASGSIESAYSTAAVTEKGSGGYAGGLVGANGGGANVMGSSFATGAVSGDSDSFVGGLVGANSGTVISSSFATGSVSVGKWDGVTPLPG